MNGEVTLHALTDIPDVTANDDLAALLVGAINRSDGGVEDGAVLAIAQKIVSKAEGRYVHLAEVQPSARARSLARKVNKDARKVQTILDESRTVVRANPPRADASEGILITEHRLGMICANAAVDESNIDQEDSILLLPIDPDASARRLRNALSARLGIDIGIVITDTFGRPWRRGLVDFAIGVAGVPALVDLAGTTDAYGRELKATIPAVGDAIASAAGLLMAKGEKSPAILFHGLGLQTNSDSTARELLRPETEDLFR